MQMTGRIDKAGGHVYYKSKRLQAESRCMCL